MPLNNTTVFYLPSKWHQASSRGYCLVESDGVSRDKIIQSNLHPGFFAPLAAVSRLVAAKTGALFGRSHLNDNPIVRADAAYNVLVAVTPNVSPGEKVSTKRQPSSNFKGDRDELFSTPRSLDPLSQTRGLTLQI